MSNIALWGDGQIAGIPVSVRGMMKEGRFQFLGRGRINSASLKALLEQWEMSGILNPFFHMVGNIDAIATISYEKETYLFALQSASTEIAFRKSGQGSDFLFTFSRSSIAKESDPPMQLLQLVVSFLGVKSLFFYCRSGSGTDIRSLSAQLPKKYLSAPSKSVQTEEAVLPAELINASIAFHGLLELKGNAFYEALHSLLGISTLDFYFYKSSKDYYGMLTIPRIQTEMFSVDELKIVVGQSNSAGFSLRLEGTVGFPPLGDDLKFLVGCGASQTSFSLTGGLTSNEPISVINDNYKIRELMLFIGYSPAGPQFGFVASLSLNQLELFAALVYSHPGRLTLLSAAISDVTFSSFLQNVTSADFGDSLASIDDILIIRAFDLCDRAPFTAQEKEKYENFVLNPVKQSFAPGSGEEKNPYLSAREGLSGYFQSKLTQSGTEDKTGLFKFYAEDVELRYLSDGNVGLVDKTKMRHYLIRKDGSIALQAQFFYAIEDISIGSYHVSKGIFACATIEVFGVTIKALLSIDEKSGCVAFAYVSKFDMKFLAVSKSSFAPKTEDKGKISLPLPENSIVYTFLEKDMDGAIFFMEASTQSVNFYFDGMITLFQVITFDARIICTQNLASIQAQLTLWGFLQLSLEMSVGYSDFQSANFKFYFAVDFSMLEESVNQVKRKIEKQIEDLRNNIGDKKNAVNQARGSLQGMYNEIGGIDSRLRDLNRNWSTRLRGAFEIGWLECKKVGIQAAIWVAERALDVAVAALDVVGNMGEDMMRFVNNAIDFAMNLFFIKKVELRAAANATVQMFEIYVEGILLGNNFTIDGFVKLNLLQKGKDYLVAFFTDLLTDKLNTKAMQGDQVTRKQVVSGNDSQKQLSQGEAKPQSAETPQATDSPGKKREQRGKPQDNFDVPEQLENLESHQLLQSVQNISGLFGDNAGFYQEMAGLLDDAFLSPTIPQEREVELLGLTAVSGIDDMVYTLGLLDNVPTIAPELIEAAQAPDAPKALQQAVADYEKAQVLAKEARNQAENLKQQKERLLAGVQAAPRRSYAAQARRMQVMRPTPEEHSARFESATDNAIRKCYQQPRASFIHLPYETGVAAPRNQVYHPRMRENQTE